MAGPNENNRQDYLVFDKMSTEELEAILRDDSQLPENEDSDTDAILYIMEVIAKREEEQSTERFTNIDIAWKSFDENYRPCISDGKSLYDDGDTDIAVTNGIKSTPFTSAKGRKPKRSRRRFTRVACVTAVIFTIVFAGSFTANVLGYNLWQAVAQWTRDTFGFTAGDLAEEDIPLRPDGEYNNLQEALDDFGIAEDLAPTWIPEGYALYSLDIMESPIKRVFFALYKKDNEDLTISITNISSETISTFEKDDSDVTIYRTEEIEHYIMSNNGWLKAVWLNNNYECYISGKISQDDLRHMIESIYER